MPEITQPGTEVARLITDDPTYVQAHLREIGGAMRLQDLETGDLVSLVCPNGVKIGRGFRTRDDERSDKHFFDFSPRPLRVLAAVAYNALTAQGGLGLTFADFSGMATPIASYKGKPFGILTSSTSLNSRADGTLSSEEPLCVMPQALNDARGLHFLVTGEYIHAPMQKVEGVWRAMPLNEAKGKYEEIAA